MMSEVVSLFHIKDPVNHQDAMDWIRKSLLNKQASCWFLEHKCVFTSRNAENLSNIDSTYVQTVDRGGGAIYHGPGQRVIYFAMPLSAFHVSDLTQLVYNLEECVFTACKKTIEHTRSVGGKNFNSMVFNPLICKRIDGPGIWIKNNHDELAELLKVCFIGLRINKDKWISHGLAINNTVDLSNFQHLRVCDTDAKVGNLNLDLKILDRFLLEEFSKKIAFSFEY